MCPPPDVAVPAALHEGLASMEQPVDFDIGVDDDVQLQFAAEHDRALLTFNTTHYLHLHRAWLQEHKEHAGIIVSDQLPIGETIALAWNGSATLPS
jgi:hypothetical protein